MNNSESSRDPREASAGSAPIRTSQKPSMSGAGDLRGVILSFTHRHRVGSVCVWPCVQCEDSPQDIDRPCMTNGEGEEIPGQPLLILRETDRAEYVRFCALTAPRPGVLPGNGPFYYEVTSD